MSFLVRVVLGVAVVGVLATVVVPRLTQSGGPLSRLRSQPPSDEAGLCVGRALTANERLGDMARRFGRPPIDADAFDAAAWDLETTIDDADVACNCPTAACGSAADALDEMRAQLSDLGAMVDGSAGAFSDPARRQERIVALLRLADSEL